MKFKILNNEPLQFYDSNANLTGTIKISGSGGDLYITPESGSSRDVIIGDSTTVGDVEIGGTSSPVNLRLLGGGTLTSNGNILYIGDVTAGDRVVISNATFTSSLQITGSLRVSGSAYAHYFVGDGSGLTNVNASASIAIKDEGVTLTSSVASIDFVGTGVSASAAGGNVTVTINGGGGGSTDTGSLLTTASFSDPNLTFTKGDGSTFNVDLTTLQPTSASYASTASYALNAGTTIDTGSFVTTSSFNSFTSSYTTASFTGSFIGDGSGLTGVISSSYALTASYVLNSISSSFSETASYYAETDPIFTSKSGSFVTTSSFNTFTGSYTTASFTGSFTGDGSGLTGVISSSYSVTSSYAVSSSQAITASYAFNAVTASIALSSLNAEDVLIYVKNVTGATINKGTVVRISGATGDNALIATASYEADNNSANTLGILNETIATDSFGYAMTEGRLLGINTAAFTAGQLLYLGATGSIIGEAPVPPLHAVRLGQALRIQSNNGSMYVRIDNGYELDELHNVLIISGSDGDLLVASGSNGNGKKLYINTRQLTGSYAITGSLTATTFTGSLHGTASYATQALTSSYAVNALTSSYAANSALLDGSAKSVFATTGSNTFIGSQTITGSLTITNDLTVIGSSSIQYITSSQLDVATNIISVNTYNPSLRFGGLAVIDSGSSPLTSGSLLFDSQNNQWIFVHQDGGTATTSSVLIMGPQTFNDIGNETTISTNRITKGTGGDLGEHIGDSNITDTGTVVSVNSNTEVTGSLLVTSNVGIGTSSPLEKLTVTDGKLFLTEADSTIGGKIYGYNDTSVNLFSGGLKFQSRYYNGSSYVYADRVTLDSSGNVGIGTTTPSVKLDVDGVGSFGSSTSIPGVTLGDYTDTFTGKYSVLSTNNHGDFTYGSNLGIDTNHQLYIINTHPTLAGSAIMLGGNNSTNGTNTISFFAKAQASVTANTIVSASSAEMVIKEGGNVGIGTTTPYTKLQVGEGVSNSNLLYRGLILQGGFSTTLQRQQNLMTFGGIGYYSSNPFDDTSAGYDRNWHIGSISDTDYFQYSRFSFVNTGIERLTILQNNGNVGIGTTTPGVKLDVQIPTGTGNQLAGRFLAGTNTTGNAGGITVGSTQTQCGYIYGEQTAASSGDLIFGTQYLGSYAERVRILANGNIGINKTTANAGLDINTDTIISGSLTVTGSLRVGGIIIGDGGAQLTGTTTVTGSLAISGSVISESGNTISSDALVQASLLYLSNNF